MRKEVKEFSMAVRTTYFEPRHYLVSTYKGAITLSTRSETIWLTAKDADKLGRALLDASKRRRQLDRQLDAESRKKGL